MQENIPSATNPIPETPIPSVDPIVPKSSKPILLYLLSFTTILACFTAGFFIWQNQKLVKNFRNSLATPTIVPSPTPSPDPTADWITYKNAKYGFEIKYPNGWKVCNLPNDSGIMLNPTENPLLCSDTGPTGAIAIYVLTNTTVKKHINGLTIPGYGRKFNKLDTTNNNFEMYESTNTSDDTHNSIHAYASFDKNLLLIELGDKKDLDIFELILSTFKFTDSKTTSPTPEL